MLASAIKWSSFFFCCFLTAYKIVPKYSAFNLSKTLIKVIILTIITLVHKHFNPDNFLILPIFMYTIFECTHYAKIKPAIVVATISYGINQILYSIISIVISLFFTLTQLEYSYLQTFIAIVIIATIHPFILLSIFRIPKFKNGMPFITQKISLNYSRISI